MCQVNKLEAKTQEFDDYVEHVQPNIVDSLPIGSHVFISYAAHNNLPIATIRDWYGTALVEFITVSSIDNYAKLVYNMDVHDVTEAINSGRFYECGGCWFETKMN